jgi:beta-lactamase superfamily II metal-dependent hydrolase
MTQVHFLNVREGDCTWIKHANGTNTVIDVCLAKSELVKAQDAAREMYSVTAKPNTIRGNYNQSANPKNPIQYLQKFGVNSVFRFILSHPDMDHMDGIKDFFKAFHPANFWDTKNKKPKPKFGKSCKYSEEDWDFYQSIRTSKDNPRCLYLYDGSHGRYYNENEDGTRGGNGLHILSPTSTLITEAIRDGDYNDCSYVLLYKIGKFKVLLCGDTGNKTFEHLKENHYANIRNCFDLTFKFISSRFQLFFSYLIE